MNTESHVLISAENRVLTIAWNRADKKNALTQSMYATAADALQSARQDDTIRVVILTGTRQCFTSGNDLNDFLNNPSTDENTPVARFLTALAGFEKPVIAAVNGPAIGVGTTMLLHCDMAVAADTALFSLPFAKLGLCPEAGSSYLLPMLAGHHRAAELLMLGDIFNAQTARECGIVNRIATEQEYQDLAKALALQLAAMPPNSLRTTKALLKAGHGAAVETAFKAEMASFAEMLSAPEAIEAMTAFMERRAADFSQF